ncbi:MAG: DUF2813 domain-containing protein [Mesorhizobium sp.]|nr:MAG: DUF2813 domain-containing protein [Mesorhizobium sp.]
MPVDYRLSKVVIKSFRGIDYFELELQPGFPTVLIGTNNAGKTTVLNAIALAFHQAEFYNWSPAETDYSAIRRAAGQKNFWFKSIFKLAVNWRCLPSGQSVMQRSFTESKS